MERTVFEQLAAIEHERWSDWQRYLHSKCLKQPDGSLMIPAELVARWERQISTPYQELSEQEKNADRKQVRRYWHIIQSRLNAVYRERNQLIALIATIYPCRVHQETQDNASARWIVSIFTPAGQLTWGVSERDMKFFRGLDISHAEAHSNVTNETTRDQERIILKLIDENWRKRVSEDDPTT